MSTYFVGTNLDAFVGSPSVTTDDAGSIVTVPGFYADAYAVDPVDGLPKGFTRMWSHGVIGSPNYAPSYGLQAYTWFNSEGLDVMRLFSLGGYSHVVQYRTGPGANDWAQPSEPVTLVSSGVYDFYVRVHPTLGRVSWYLNGTLCGDTQDLDTSAMVDVARLRVSGYQNYAGATSHSSVILASYNTIGHTVTRRAPTGPGGHQDWTGTYLDIDDGGADDTDAISTSTTGDIATFTGDALPPLSQGNVIKAIAFASRLRNDGGAVPTNAKALLTVGGADYLAPANMMISSGFRGSVSVFDVNPATGAPWTMATAPEAFGVIAVD